MREKQGVKAEDVERIEIGVTRYTYDKLSYAQPGTELEGKFSMAYPVARALIDGAVTLGTFTDEAVKEGMITLLQDGFMKALEGITTIEEILRVAED